jgi:hypothetical protein
LHFTGLRVHLDELPDPHPDDPIAGGIAMLERTVSQRCEGNVVLSLANCGTAPHSEHIGRFNIFVYAERSATINLFSITFGEDDLVSVPLAAPPVAPFSAPLRARH